MPAPKTLLKDERAFDAAMVGSALKFLTRFQGPPNIESAAKAAEPFAWVPEIALKRARLSGFDLLEPWTLPVPMPERVPAMLSGKRVLVYPTNDDTSADHCNTLALRFWLGVLAIQGSAARDPDTEQWLVKQLRTLDFATRYQYRDGRAQLVSVPVPRSVEACLAYALAVLAEDRWNFRNRVGKCPYVRMHDSKTHFEPDHWFFDVDARGKLPISAPLKFCNRFHANAYRQRQLRSKP